MRLRRLPLQKESTIVVAVRDNALVGQGSYYFCGPRRFSTSPLDGSPAVLTPIVDHLASGSLQLSLLHTSNPVTG